MHDAEKREKVISALEKRYDPERDNLHLVIIPNGLVQDALALLKEQEAVEPKLYTPTTPTFWKSWYTCGVCEWPVREKTEWGSGDKFCPKCGRRIKWPKKEEDENV